ncbi:MAG: entry exclusion 1 domain-containing protein [Rhodospirillales bacterium]|nr:entry exclusion 1 domain-containing protein [Alphaproteobacteria bacterium]MCB1841088.1 entry exclusion 1 domain-containing protein [Alphaproteobacteria bacterium]MCB9977700.1 entry exclusion 1 domain-containing protein [Rhodospirillales bacterium]
MAKVGAQRAAVLTGKSKSTIQRAMNSGKLSYSLDQNDRRVIDVSELERVFGIKPESLQAGGASAPSSSPVNSDIEKERLALEIKLLELRLENAQEQIEDLRGQRDKWENQANQVLLTTQHTHKQIEDLRAEIREMDEKIKPKRNAAQGSSEKSSSAQSVKKISAGNQNANTNNSPASRFMFWKKAKA